MTDIKKYEGIIPAFYACYDEKGEINPAAVREMTRWFIEKGVKGLYVGGSSGEQAATLTADLLLDYCQWINLK